MTMTPAPKSSSQTLLLLIAATVVFYCLLFAVAQREPHHLQTAQENRKAKTIEKGAALYSLHCYSCHGIRGEGVGQLGPALSDNHFFTARMREVGWQSTLEQYVVATIEQGRLMGTRPIYAGNGSTAVMAPWHIQYGGPLRTDEIAATAAFILNWEATAKGEAELVKLELPEPSREDPKLLGHGEQVFIENCSNCHLFNSSGKGRIGPNLTKIAQRGSTRIADMNAEEYLRRSILVPHEYIVEGYNGNDLSEDSCGALLSRGDLLSLTAFLLQ